MKKRFIPFIVFVAFSISSCELLDKVYDMIFPSSSPSESVSESASESTSNTTSEASTQISEGEHFDGTIEDVVYNNFRINFMELGVYNTGDATYIKAGDIDILIDAGAKEASAGTIIEYVDQYCKDGILEYVITTHAHTDHFTGMFGNSKNTKNYKGENVSRTGIMYYYQIGTIIDFALTNSTSSADTTNYGKYLAAVNYAVGNGATHYTAAQCFNNEDGASSHYVLDEAQNISMDILYNKYYFEKSSDENNYSVCTLFNYNDLHFLLTGDLEEGGEKSLAEYYDKSSEEKTLPHCKLFKAGHHGSKTSSNDCLLSLITPEICCVCCCAGGSEYTNISDNTFPTQEFIDRISKYTDRVYVTSQIDEKATRETNSFVFKSMNGDIVVSSNGYAIGLAASNNLIKLKDSEWFNETIYMTLEGALCTGKGKKDFFTSATEGALPVVRRVWPGAEVE